ncbi:MAG: RNA methyltransferase [Candidatus Sumerlaeaceae bacterium]|nr:RNA methyltransferase [Candidatus Sumerlaeaceae bacterium]
MPRDVYAVLLHYPVTDKQGDVVSTSITNLDIHDISRASRTFGLKRYFLVTPIEPQQWLAKRIIHHWDEGWGSTYNPNRKDALGIIEVASDLGAVSTIIAEISGAQPKWVTTSAKSYPNSVTFSQMRSIIESDDGPPICLMFGTGWGIHPEIMLESDYVLEPIRGAGDYNHLSVRSAASIIFHELLGRR